MAVVFPRQVWVLKRELLWIPVVGWGIRQLHAIAIDRQSGHSAVGQVVEQGKQRLEEGDWIIGLPRRTRMASWTDAQVRGEWHVAGDRVQQVIVPVAAQRGKLLAATRVDEEAGNGAGRHWSTHRCAWRDAREINREVQEWVEATVARLTA